MPCDVRHFPGEVTIANCSRERHACIICGARATNTCAFPLKGRLAGKSCGRHLCAGCATTVSPDTHFCPAHTRAFKENACNPK